MVDEDLVIDIDELDLHDMGEDSSGDEEAEDPAAAVGAAAVTVSVAAEVKEQVGVPVENNDIVETVVKKDVVGEIIDGAIEVKEEVEGTKERPAVVFISSNPLALSIVALDNCLVELTTSISFTASNLA